MSSIRNPRTPGTSVSTGERTQRSKSVEYWRQLLWFDRKQVAPLIAFRNAIGISIPIVAGVLAGRPDYGVVAGFGAMDVSHSDGNDPYALRVRRMLAATAAAMVAIITGSLFGQHPPVAIAIVAVWAFTAGLLVAWSSNAAGIGQLSLVLMLVYSGQYVPPQEAINFGLFAAAGGLLQIVLSVASWPLRRHEPELRLLAGLYADLSRITSSDVSPTAAPPVSERATKTRYVFSRLGRVRTMQHERSVSLLAQAERVRLSILMLGRVRSRWLRDPDLAQRAAVLDDCFSATSGILADIGRLLSGHRTRANPASLAVLHDSAERLKLMRTRGGLDHKTVGEAARRQIEALAGQLRSALELAAASTDVGQLAFRRTEAMRPWRLRIEGGLATFRANATLKSSAFRHAVRLSGSVLAGEIAAYSLGGARSYWLPMTVVLVLRPDFMTTFSRGALRLAGTLAGLLLATALFQLGDPGPATVIASVFITAFVLRCFGPANYGILATAVSAIIVLLFSLRGQAPDEVVQQRGWNTLWGGLLALAAYAVWPTWERSHVGSTIADLLDAYRAYFGAVHNAYVHTGNGFEHNLDRTRNGARLARSNAEASVDRFKSEPGASEKLVRLAEGILASSHRFVHAVMALEAGLAQNNPVGVLAASARIGNDIEITLHSLAAGLRGSALTREMLPDVREAWGALNYPEDAGAQAYAFLNVEMDRITDSLITLADQVVQFKLNMAGRVSARE